VTNMAGPTPEERADLMAKSAGGRSLAGLRLVSLEEGATRGQRVLELRTAHGLEAEIAVDRGFDIAALRYRGLNIGWVGPTDHPATIDPEREAGFGLLRSFQGFLVTCGLDHHGLPECGPADHFQYPNRTTINYPLHGRVSGTPAILERRTIDFDAVQPEIMCVGLVRQVALFGEVLELRRVVRMPVFGSSLRIEDVVTNRGSTPARHGILYHLNIGYPLLDATSIIRGIDPSVAAAFNANPPRPDPLAVETFQLAAPADSQNAEVNLSNPKLGLELTIKYDAALLPSLGVWRAEQSGIYALGIEPHTNLGPATAPYALGNKDFLLPGERKSYVVEVDITSQSDDVIGY